MADRSLTSVDEDTTIDDVDAVITNSDGSVKQITFSTIKEWIKNLINSIIKIDNYLSDKSTNPVQNMIITNALQNKITKPSSEGTSGQFLQSNGDGITTWADAPSGGGGNFIIDLTSIGCDLYDEAFGDDVLSKIRSGIWPIIFNGISYSIAVYAYASSDCGGSLKLGYYSFECGSPYLTYLQLCINYS